MSNLFQRSLAAIVLPAVVLISCSKKIIADKPSLPRTDFKMDSLPESEINIPIQVNLRPLYLMAEKSVDTAFFSPNWPDGWVQDGCDTRYKYRFRRGPLQVKTVGPSLI